MSSRGQTSPDLGLGEKLDEKSIAINLPGSAKIAKAQVSNGFLSGDGHRYVKASLDHQKRNTSIVLTSSPHCGLISPLNFLPLS